MSTTLFPVLTSQLWREAIARGRAEGEMDLLRFRAQVASSKIIPVAGSATLAGREAKRRAEAGGGDSLSTIHPGAGGSANGKHAPIAKMNAAPGSL